MHVHAGKLALTLQKQACVHVAVHEQTEKHGIWIKQWAWNKRLRLQGGRVYGTERDKEFSWKLSGRRETLTTNVFRSTFGGRPWLRNLVYVMWKV